MVWLGFLWVKIDALINADNNTNDLFIWLIGLSANNTIWYYIIGNHRRVIGE